MARALTDLTQAQDPTTRDQKILMVMRHAKSSWKQPGLSDFDRPLNKRGRLAAPLMAETLAARQLLPELILSSTAERARQTSEILVSSWSESSGWLPELRLEDSLYLAGPQSYLQALAHLAENQNRVMVVGHNPGLEYLIEKLTGEDPVMPTAAVALVGFEGPWNRPQNCELIDVWRPKEVAGSEIAGSD